MKTIESIEAAKQDLMERGRDAIADWKVGELRHALSSVGVTAVEQDGGKSVWKARKGTLVAALERVFDELEASRPIAPEPAFNIQDLSRTDEFKAFVAATSDKFKSAIEAVADIDGMVKAGQEVSIEVLDDAEADVYAVGAAIGHYCLNLIRHRDKVPYSASAKANARNEISKLIRDQLRVDDTLSTRAHLGIDRFIAKLDIASRSVLKAEGVYSQKMTKYKNKEYQEQREQEHTAIDPTRLLGWAENVLRGPLDNWKDTSVALALVTGRRMVELHHFGCFDVVDEPDYPYEVVGTMPSDFYGPHNTLWFEGQAKAKRTSKQFYEEYPGYAIPTLVDARVVMDAMGHNRREDQPHLVNTRLSSELSRRVKKVLGEYLPELDRKVTYHTLRDIYALVANRMFNDVPDRAVLFACVVLGHERDIRTPQSVIASGTSLSYLDELKLADSFMDDE